MFPTGASELRVPTPSSAEALAANAYDPAAWQRGFVDLLGASIQMPVPVTGPSTYSVSYVSIEEHRDLSPDEFMLTFGLVHSVAAATQLAQDLLGPSSNVHLSVVRDSESREQALRLGVELTASIDADENLALAIDEFYRRYADAIPARDALHMVIGWDVREVAGVSA
jgi:hypothetical protein